MESVTVRMRRAHLDDIPQFSLPDGYRLHWYQPGDERHWVDIHLLADGIEPLRGKALFREEFGADSPTLTQRQCYLLNPRREPIGTATAWFDGEVGRLHWVAIVPEYQGRGLAKPLLTAVCNRMVELGHASAYLVTHTHRLPAIALYRKFGFEPWIESEEERAAWAALERGHP